MTSGPARLELWGGIECSIVRLGDRYHSQLEANGHLHRAGDLDRLAALGLRTLRYPVLWEQVAPAGPARADWRWPDERLGRLRALGIRPIVGLLHHGSGPVYTSLVADGFPEALAEYAGAVAARYPWVDAYQPVNEPLTTARFGALYGLWYPHARDDRAFVRAVVNQCRGAVLAMRAIRRINPRAQFVQNDDLGTIFSDRALAYQARFENERRWLAWDLLCGRVDRDHYMWKYLRWSGVRQRDIQWFRDNACPPDLIAIDHYVTSDRYLHQREAWCPSDRWGGNGRDRYADTEAVRVLDAGRIGLEVALRAVWDRYRLPVVVAESHLGCTRDEQLRWLKEFWDVGLRLRTEGIDVRAITAWALFGTCDWNSLLTRFTGHYEPGAFDVRGPEPRPTALAELIRALATTGVAPLSPIHEPVLSRPGWWRRPARLYRGAGADASAGTGVSADADASTAAGPPEATPCVTRPRTAMLLITGATGTLGRAFARICERRDLDYRLCTRAELDITDRASIDRTLGAVRPWAVINAAGYVRVDDAERDPDRCYRENHGGPTNLAAACAERGLPLVTFSSDLVFDGRSVRPYVESQPARPLNVYGASKARAEVSVLSRHPDALVIRTSSFFGPWDRYNFLTRMFAVLAEGGEYAALHDVVISPTYVPDLVDASLDLLIDRASGLWHVVNRGAVSWHEFAHQAAAIARVRGLRLLRPVCCEDTSTVAPRPRYTPLTSERGLMLPALDDAIGRYVAERRVA